MVNVKELVCEHVKTLENYSRSKAAKEVCIKLKAQNIECDRGVISAVYNAVDERSRELNREFKSIHVVRAVQKSVIVNDGEDFLRENVTITHRTDRKFTLTESVRAIFAQVEDAAKKFVKEPSESRIKTFYRKARVLSSALFQLAQSTAPEDKTFAENCGKRLEQLRDSVKMVGVQA